MASSPAHLVSDARLPSPAAFETLCGPFSGEIEKSALVLRFQSGPQHAGEDGAVHDGALLAFADFSMFAIVNHHADGAYADRANRDLETIVTLSLSAQLLARPSPGAALSARGRVVRISRRNVLVEGAIADETHVIATFQGSWAKTAPPAAAGGDQGFINATEGWLGSPFAKQIGPIWASRRRGAVSAIVHERHCNPLGIMHGGMGLGLIAAAHRAVLGSGRLAALSVSFLAPGGLWALVDAQVMAVGEGPLQATRGEMTSRGELLAHYGGLWLAHKSDLDGK